MHLEQARFLLHNLDLQKQQVQTIYRTFEEREMKDQADEALRGLNQAAYATQKIVQILEKRNAPKQHQG